MAKKRSKKKANLTGAAGIALLALLALPLTPANEVETPPEPTAYVTQAETENPLEEAFLLAEDLTDELTTDQITPVSIDRIPESESKIAEITQSPTETIPEPTESEPTQATPKIVLEIDYVLNTNTKKFHYPECSSVKDIKPGHRKDVTGERSDIINMGYVPCKRCNP